MEYGKCLLSCQRELILLILDMRQRAIRSCRLRKEKRKLDVAYLELLPQYLDNTKSLYLLRQQAG